MWSFPKNLLRATLEKAQSIFRRGNSSVLQELQGGGEEGETLPTKAGMEEALLGWVLVGLGFESSTCSSGDAFALCRGCSWSHPGAASGSVSWHSEIPQESSFPLLLLHSPTPFPLLVSRLAPLVAFLEPSCQAVHTLWACWEQNKP